MVRISARTSGETDGHPTTLTPPECGSRRGATQAMTVSGFTITNARASRSRHVTTTPISVNPPERAAAAEDASASVNGAGAANQAPRAAGRRASAHSFAERTLSHEQFRIQASAWTSESAIKSLNSKLGVYREPLPAANSFALAI